MKAGFGEWVRGGLQEFGAVSHTFNVVTPFTCLGPQESDGPLKPQGNAKYDNISTCIVYIQLNIT